MAATIDVLRRKSTVRCNYHELRETHRLEANVSVDTDLLMLLLFSDSGLKIIRWSRRATVTKLTLVEGQFISEI